MRLHEVGPDQEEKSKSLPMLHTKMDSSIRLQTGVLQFVAFWLCTDQTQGRHRVCGSKSCSNLSHGRICGIGAMKGYARFQQPRRGAKKAYPLDGFDSVLHLEEMPIGREDRDRPVVPESQQ